MSVRQIEFDELKRNVVEVENDIESVSNDSENLRVFIQGLVDLLGYHTNKEEMSPEDFVKCVRKFCDERRFYV